MTRKEHLEFCKKCLNRKLDTRRGLICKLTEGIADFEGECENFKIDGSVTIEPKEEIPLTQNEVKYRISQENLHTLRKHQDFLFAFIGGSLAALVSGVIWAAITVATKYQIGYMAIGVGLLVGFTVRFFGAGIDKKFGILGALLSLAGCALGNLLSQIGFIAKAESMSYIEVISYLNVPLAIELFKDAFSPLDVLFYGIAIYEGYKFAFRQLSSHALAQLVAGKSNGAPEGQKLRMPLVVITAIVLSFVSYTVSKGYSGTKFYTYESGAKMSEGEVKNNKEYGKWTYYYESGNLHSEGNFLKGKAEGEWKWYSEAGNVIKKGIYKNGMEDGVWMRFGENGNMLDSGNYVSSRLDGYWKYWYENGQLSQEGNYDRNEQVGEWKSYYDNGNLVSKGEYAKGIAFGNWETYFVNGQKASETYVDSASVSIVNNIWDKDGNHLVVNGNGLYKLFYDDGVVMEKGEVKDGKRVGVWTQYYPDGKPYVENVYEGVFSKIVNCWNREGEQIVKEGQGEYISYYEGTDLVSEKGSIQDSLREGDWELYYNTGNNLYQKSVYHCGLPDGLQQSYYQSGQLASSGMMKEGKQEGEWTWYFENGVVSSKVNFENGEKQGLQQMWDEGGNLSKEEEFENGKLIKEEII